MDGSIKKIDGRNPLPRAFEQENCLWKMIFGANCFYENGF
jgi:hypothetical protein